MIRDNGRDLARRVERAHVVREAAPLRRRAEEPVTLRLARPHDAAALLRLTQLEQRPEPRGSYVVAEIDGEVVAALPLPNGRPLGDPFRPTAHLVPLLELRARQLERPRSRRLPVALWGALRGSSS